MNVFLDKLKNKTRILVTHAVDFLHLVDFLIIMKEGYVVNYGKYEDL
jgi:ABC-type transport system involved in cytochrome bd biosynthesis fused ATPase/permease subunit